MNDIRIEIMPLVAQAWRRRWQAMSITLAVCLFGWLVVALMPNRYQSSARIYVDTQSLLSPLMKGMAVNYDLNQQVQIMQRTLLSRPNLESVMRSTDLDLAVASPGAREDMVRDLRKHTEVKAEGNNLFYVAFEDRDPLLAKRVVQALLTIFVESNLGASRRDMEQARQFIDEQIRTYEQKLKAAEGRLAQFKQRNLQFLPESGRYINIVERAREGLGARREELADAQTRLKSQEDQLTQVPQFLSVETAPQVIIAGLAQPVRSEIDQRVADMQNQLSQLKLRYTERHPDVIIAAKSLASLIEQRQSQPQDITGRAGNTTMSGRIPNPLYERLKLAAVETSTTVEMLERRVEEQRKVLAEIEARAVQAPQIEAEFVALNRDYDVLKANYQMLLERRESARMSQEMDSRADKVIQFRVIEPPEVPIKPNAPNKVLVATLVLAAGLGAGGLVTVVLVMQAQSFGSPRSLRDSFDVPVLGSVSAAMTTTMRRDERISATLFFVGLVALFVAYALFLAHFNGTLGRMVESVAGIF